MLYEKFGDWQLVLAAYNAGPGTVQRAIERNQAAGLPTDFWSLHLPAETLAYVPRFLAVIQIIKSPETYGVSLRPVVDQPFFRVISLNSSQIDMTAAATYAGISLKELYQLNPGFSRWATDPDGPHRLLVPASLPQDYENQITSLPAPELVTVTSYHVQKGDTLFRIAKRFNVTPEEIRQANNLSSDAVPVGHTLTITRAKISPEFVALNEEMHLDRSAFSMDHPSAHRYTYTVHHGDTVASVASRHGMSVRALARLNGISPRTPLHAGQRLALLHGHGHGGNPHHLVASNGKTEKDLQKIHYQVKKGDTLVSIGRHYNVSVHQIKHWNGTVSHIHPGHGIVLYVASNNPRRL
jgi:membrane-bound lytic murein transglycosylase D